jgi:PAS domain S-box-containing protein
MQSENPVFLLTAIPKRFIVIPMKHTSSQINLEQTFWNFSNIVLIIKDNYNFSYLNSHGINLLGYAEAQINEMSFIELLTPDSLEECIENIRQLRETSFCRPFIINLVKRNGGIVSIELSGLKLADGRFFFTGRNLSIDRIHKERMQYLEDLNTHVLNSLGEGIVVLDPKANIIKFNDFMERHLQWNKTYIGKNVFRLFPNLKRYGLLEAFVTIIDKGITIKKDRISGKKNDGELIVFNITGYPLRRKKDIRGAVVVIEDITKREVITKNMQKAKNLREKMHRIIEDIIRLKTIPEILESVTNGLKDDIKYNRGGIFLIDASKRTPCTIQIFSSVNTGTETANAQKQIARRIFSKKGHFNSVFKEGRPTIIGNVQKKPRLKGMFPDTQCMIIVPIRLKEKSIGMIVIESTERGSLDETDLKFLEMLANGIAISLEKIKFLEDLLDKARYLSIIYETGQLLQKSPKGKTKFKRILKHIAQDLEDCMILILSFAHNKSPNVVADWETPDDIKNIFAKARNSTRQEISKSVISGNPFVLDAIQMTDRGLLKKLRQQAIKSLYMFPFLNEQSLTGCLIVLSHNQAVLKREQISLLTAVANQLSVYPSTER